MASNFDQHFDLDRDGRKVLIRFKQVTLTGREEMDQLFRRLDEVVNMTPAPDLVLSFKRVNHLSSVFLGKLMALHKKVQKAQGRLVLTEVSPQVREIFILTRIAEHITIVDDGQDAEAALAQKRRGGRRSMVAAGAVIAAAILLAVGYYLLKR